MKEHGAQSLLVRKPAFAGSFYPSSKDLLVKQLEKLFGEAKSPASDTPPQAIISPHAGYVFSGQVAASAYNQLTTKAAYKRVFVLASSHHNTFHGASLSSAHYYETPLGKVKVDRQVADKLLGMSDLLQCNEEAHRDEHSLEVQLPFIQHKLGADFLLVPLVLGTYDSRECEKIALLLEPWFTPENLFVISTDFSHYPAYNDAVENDFNTAQAICSNNAGELLETINRKKNINNLATSLCGWTSVLTLLYLTQHKKMKFVQVQYSNSGDVPEYGETERVVGYWAIVVYNDEENLTVPKHQQVEMLENARKAILLFLLTGKLMHPLPPSGPEKKIDGMFISVYVKGKLRGCIGNLNGTDSMDQALEQLAVSASCDTRFDSLTLEEFDDLELEISVLSTLRKIESIQEIVPGRHGIYIQKGSKSGTFLPKVAERMGWSVEELLGYCARDKAGLRWDGWKNADIFIYEAFAFRG